MRNFRCTHPKTRADCVIERRLTPEAARDLARRLDHGLPHRDAARWLLDEHHVQLSESSISRWAARRRRLKSEKTLRDLCDARQRAPAAAASGGDGGPDPSAANLRLLTDALSQAHQNEDRHGMIQAARLFSQMLEARAKVYLAQAAAAGSGQRPGEREIAARALACAAELHAISLSRDLDRGQKIAQIAQHLFGAAPVEAPAPIFSPARCGQRHPHLD